MKNFKKVYTMAQAKQDPRVSDMFAEHGNIDSDKYDYWINLKEGYVCRATECGSIHEQTVKECLWYLNNDVVEGTEDHATWQPHPNDKK